MISRPVTVPPIWALGCLCIFVSLVAAGCGQPLVERPVSTVAEPGLDQAAERAVQLSTTACGFAPPTDGSGLVLQDRLILTAAHVVAGASEVFVSAARTDSDPDANPDPAERAARVVAYDTLRDLAIVELEMALAVEAGAEPFARPLMRDIDEGDAGTIIGGATSGNVEFEVSDKTIIEIDEVRGSRRSQRSGYILQAQTNPGDSGSGLYDPAGYLVGLLFAVSTADQGRSWATAADEIDDFLSEQSFADEFVCDADRSRLKKGD